MDIKIFLGSYSALVHFSKKKFSVSAGSQYLWDAIPHEVVKFFVCFFCHIFPRPPERRARLSRIGSPLPAQCEQI